MCRPITSQRSSKSRYQNTDDGDAPSLVLAGESAGGESRVMRRNNPNDFHGSAPWHKCKICTCPTLRLSLDYKTQYGAGFLSKKETKLVLAEITVSRIWGKTFAFS